MMPEVSIIVPAFNAEAFIGSCLRSLLCQTYPNIEIIVVDDGSTDNTGAIADSFNAPVRVVRQANGGLSAARNKGLEVASGDFVLFCDADDEYHPEAVRFMMGMIDEDVDIVSGNLTFREFRPNSSLNGSMVSTDGHRMALSTLYQKAGFNNSMCGKIFRRSMFENIPPFKVGSMYEDLEISLRLFASARRVVIVDAEVYYYRQHGGSFLHSWSKSRTDVLDVTEALMARSVAYGEDMVAAARSRAFSAAWNILLLAARNGSWEVVKRCRRTIKSLRKSVLADQEVRLKNKIGAVASFFILF